MALGGLFIVSAAACNPSSDASRIIESENISYKATISYYEGLGPTMTAEVDARNQQVQVLQAELSTAQAVNRDLTSRINAQRPQPTALPNPGGNTTDPGVETTPMQGNNTASNGSGMTFAEVVMSRGINDNNCALEPTTTFTIDDAEIYVVARILNIPRGTTFTATWQGTEFSREDSYTVPANNDEACLYFYVVPSEIGMVAGTYTVTFSATELAGTPIEFTIQ
jgi:hypothetical protein